MADDASRCQSCGLRTHVGNFGTNASGSMNTEYCNLCFQKGAFTDMDMTCARQVQLTTASLINIFGVDEKEAFEEAKELVPRLKRWKGRF